MYSANLTDNETTLLVAAIGVIGLFVPLIKLLFENRAQHGQGLGATSDLKDIVVEGFGSVDKRFDTLTERVDENHADHGARIRRLENQQDQPKGDTPE